MKVRNYYCNSSILFNLLSIENLMFKENDNTKRVQSLYLSKQ